jgi:DNA invertase Pin-like site-specific DNA recombinase
LGSIVTPVPTVAPVCCLYARVSTRDKDQDPQNQLLQLQAFCESKKWKVAQIYQDHESAGGGKVREAYTRLFRDAAKPGRKWDLLMFWSLDRFSREGVYETLHKLKELDRLGVRFLSLQEQYLDTLGPFREAVMAILAAVAALERNRISERVKAGIARCKLEGKVFGRRPAMVDEDKLVAMQSRGASLSQMAAAVGTSRTTVLRRLRRLDSAASGSG